MPAGRAHDADILRGEARSRNVGTDVERNLRAALTFGLICAVVFLAHAIRVVSAPLEQTLAVVPDDAFYYFKIAQHIAARHGSTFDGVHPTNGYHPLWMLCLVGLAHWPHDNVTYLRAAQAMAFVVHAGGAAFLFLLLRSLVSPAWAAFCAATWLVTPWGLLQASQAMEAPLYQACVFGLLLAHRRITASPTPDRWRHRAAYGAALATVALARTDGVLLCALSVVGAVKHGWTEPSARRARLYGVAASVVGAIVIWGLWATASWAAVGSIVQDSAVMKTLWRGHGITPSSAVPADALTFLLVWFLKPTALLAWGNVWSAATPLASGLLAVIVLLASTRRRAFGPQCTLSFWLVGWAVLTGVLYYALLSDLQLWHMVPAAIALIVTVSILGPAAVRGGGRMPLMVPALVAGAYIVCSSVADLRTQRSPYPWQVDIYRSLRRFDAQLGPHDRVGSFNAGIAGYFSQREVINLDGLVNHSVIGDWQAGSWSTFVERAHITHIADERSSLERALSFSSRSLALTELDEFPMRQWRGGPRVLWRVGWVTSQDHAPAASRDPRRP